MILDDEEAKAAQEVAKITGKGIDASRELGGFFNTICGEGLKELGGAFKDWATVFRYTNTFKLQDKVEAIHEKRGITGKTSPIPLREAIPLIEAASIESDESLQDMWAALTANSTDPNKNLYINKVYIKILSDIEPLDAKVLRSMCKDGIVISGDGDSDEWESEEDILKSNDARRDELRISLQNLARLLLVESRRGTKWSSLEVGLGIGDSDAKFKATHLARSLLEACKE